MLIKNKFKSGTVLFLLALSILVILGGIIYSVLEREPTEESLAAVLNNSDFNFFENERIFQDEPESQPVPNALKIPIFIYHSVRPHIAGESKIQDDYDITPELFEKQLAYLQNNGYTTITLNDLVNDIKRGTTMPVLKPVILTFDDGWENQYKNAFPLLKKYHATATFYVYTNPIGKKKHFLNWDQIKEMDAAGMTIAGHTLSHPYMKQLSADELAYEIIDGKKILETELGKPVRHFASPFGYTSPEIISILKKAGYVTGRTTYKGIYHTEDSLLRLRGFLVNDSLDDFIKILNH